MKEGTRRGTFSFFSLDCFSTTRPTEETLEHGNSKSALQFLTVGTGMSFFNQHGNDCDIKNIVNNTIGTGRKTIQWTIRSIAKLTTQPNWCKQANSAMQLGY